MVLQNLYKIFELNFAKFIITNLEIGYCQSKLKNADLISNICGLL